MLIPSVRSHPRSGTHLLMATLYENFMLPECAAEIESEGLAWYETGETRARVPWAGLFGGHSPWAAGGDSTAVIYIVRHPHDCLYSCWRAWDADRCGPDESMTPEWIEHWRQHVLSFVDAGCFWIKYEDLVADCAAVLARIEQRLGLTRRTADFRRVDHPVGWSPAEGRSGYGPRLNPETRARFLKILGTSFLGYEI
jgi:hypothetical protein